MSSFRFRLATLKRLRDLRDECRQRLAEAQQAEELIALRLTTLDGDVAALQLQTRAGSRPGPIDVDRLLDAQRFHLILEAEISATQQQRQAVAAEVERRRQTLVDADREVKVLDKLRQRQEQSHRDAQGKREFKMLDERAMIQAASRAGSHSGIEQEVGI